MLGNSLRADMSKTGDGTGGPRAVIHKRILDVASDDPDASLADIAAEVSGANTDLVDRVLSEYGDPAEAEIQASEAEGSERIESGEQRPPVTDPEELTQKQLRTMHAVYDRPEATQGDIATRLGVTPATVSRRLSAVPGFEWGTREPFTAALFADTEYETGLPVAGDVTATAEESMSEERPTDTADDDATAEDAAETAPTLAGLDARLAAIEDDLNGETRPARPLRRELAHRVVHAAMASELIDGDEELELIEELLG